MKGEEMGFLLRHYKTYNAILGYSVNYKKQDPLVYEKPKSNSIFLLNLFRWNGLLH